MATFLEAGLFGYFNSLFVFLFVLVACYAILTTIKVFGENAAINAIISFILACISASSSYISKIFAYATPWIVLFFLFCLFIVILFKFLGAEPKDIPVNPTYWPSMGFAMALIILIIFIFSAGQVAKENKAQLEKEGKPIVQTFPEKIADILRQPSMLGLMMVLLIATFAIMLLASTPK